jgi:hypothetical protein
MTRHNLHAVPQDLSCLRMGNMNVAVLQQPFLSHTDGADLTELHGKSKKSVLFRVIREIRVPINNRQSKIVNPYNGGRIENHCLHQASA